MSKRPSQPKTQVPEIPQTVIEENVIEPQPEKPRSRPRRGNPALTAINPVGTKLGADGQAEAAASKARLESSRQEAIAQWKKMT